MRFIGIFVCSGLIACHAAAEDPVAYKLRSIRSTVTATLGGQIALEPQASEIMLLKDDVDYDCYEDGENLNDLSAVMASDPECFGVWKKVAGGFVLMGQDGETTRFDDSDRAE
jgi:hypothetical protein